MLRLRRAPRGPWRWVAHRLRGRRTLEVRQLPTCNTQQSRKPVVKCCIRPAMGLCTLTRAAAASDLVPLQCSIGAGRSRGPGFGAGGVCDTQPNRMTMNSQIKSRSTEESTIGAGLLDCNKASTRQASSVAPALVWITYPPIVSEPQQRDIQLTVVVCPLLL